MNKIILSSLVVALTAMPALAETAAAQSKKPVTKAAINKTLSQKTAEVSRSFANLRKSAFIVYVNGKMLNVNSGRTEKNSISTLAIRIDKNWLLLRGSYGFVTNPVFSDIIFVSEVISLYPHIILGFCFIVSKSK